MDCHNIVVIMINSSLHDKRQIKTLNTATVWGIYKSHYCEGIKQTTDSDAKLVLFELVISSFYIMITYATSKVIKILKITM